MKPLNTFASLITESVKPLDEPDKLWEHFSIPAFDEGKAPVNELGCKIKSGKYRVKKSAVLASKLNPDTERTWWIRPSNEDQAVCSTEFMQFVPNEPRSRAYLYSLIRSEAFQSEMKSRTTGSTGSRQRTQPRAVHGTPVLDPGSRLQSIFSQKASCFLDRAAWNVSESRALVRVRDALLPKLLSGELTIPAAEKPAADVL